MPDVNPNVGGAQSALNESSASEEFARSAGHSATDKLSDMAKDKLRDKFKGDGDNASVKKASRSEDDDTGRKSSPNDKMGDKPDKGNPEDGDKPDKKDGDKSEGDDKSPKDKLADKAKPGEGEGDNAAQNALQKGNKIKQAIVAGKNVGSGALKVGILSKLLNFAKAMMLTLANVASTVSSGIGSFLAGVWSAVVGGFNAVVGFVGGAIGVGAHVAVTIVTAVAVGVTSVAVGVGGVLINSNNVGVRDGELIDCADNKNLKMYGDNTIPETIGGMRVGYVTTREYTFAVGKGMLNHNSNQYRLLQWIEEKHGGAYEDENGFTRIKGMPEYYLIAIQPTPFGNPLNTDAHVGDQVTFYLDNGYAIQGIVCDTKGDVSGSRTDGKDGGKYNFRDGTTSWDEVVPINTPTGPAKICAYGHIVGDKDVNVLEFMGDSRIDSGAYSKMPGNEGGTHTVSFTNNGPIDGWKEYSGMGGTVLDAAGAANSLAGMTQRGRARDNCVKVRKYDNATMAMAAISFATATKEEATGNDGTQLYQKVHDAVGMTTSYKDCGGVVGSAVRWSGYDDDFPTGGTTNMMAHCLSSDKWQKVGMLQSLSIDDLQPGDIGINSGHIFMFTGHELIQQVHGDKAKPDSNSVSGSLGERAAGCDNSTTYFHDYGDSRGDYTIFRCTNTQRSDKFIHAGD